MRDEAEKRIGHLYPTVEVTAEMSRERPDLMAPAEPEFGKAVQQDCRRTVLRPRLGEVQAKPVEGDVAVADGRFEHRWGDLAGGTVPEQPGRASAVRTRRQPGAQAL